MDIFKSSFMKIYKRGFTLVEALIATILVGTCIMPIVGTMQNAESMTQRMVNDNKLQMLARSRMNLETSRANNEQKFIDETTGWLYEWYANEGDTFPQSEMTYVAPKDYYKTNYKSDQKFKNMLRVYRIEVKVTDDAVLKSYKKDDKGNEEEEMESGLKGLKKVVVTSQIVGEEGQFYILEDNSSSNEYNYLGKKYKINDKYSTERGSISLTPPPRRCTTILPRFARNRTPGFV